jgi:hypothetical protein
LRKILIICLLAAPSLAVGQSPSDTVRFFYDNPGFELDPANRELYALPARAVLDQHDLVWETKEDLCIDFSPAFDAQDFDEAELERTLEIYEEIEADIADVFASFTLFGEPREIVWSLERDGDWKVADIASPEGGWRLSEFTCE